MPTTPRDRLARLLAGPDSTHADSATVRLPPDTLRVHVAEVGEVAMPIRAAQAKKLIAVARPAAYGHGQETLHDHSVRDTWELAPDQVTLGGDDWQYRLERVLSDFRDTLGLPPDSRLHAELHSMLVYGKGQFFLPHQDSEKHDEMVATLVVVLPSVHTGGELVVDDGGRERVYHASRDELTLVAFYADRRHEVRPVRSGHRVTLTFNLLLTTPPKTEQGQPVPRAAALLTEHFTTPLRSRYGDRDLGTPTRLAFLLDHEYTQRGLTAARFKGADAARVETLRAAAEQAGCECVFALADIHETRDAWSDGGQNDWYTEEFDDDWDQDANDVTAGDLIDGEISLRWWITPDASRGEKVQLGLGDDEVCAATPSAALTPYQSEYEGYMGNYGNTIDRWYHRAAMVLWPKHKAFANRAEANPDWALRAVQRTIASGDLEAARADVLSMESFWKSADPANLGRSLRVAFGLRDPAAASAVLASYRLEMLTDKEAKLLGSVVVEYGVTWWSALLNHWDAGPHYGENGRVEWAAADMVPVCRALVDEGMATIADQLTDRVWRWLWRRAQVSIDQDHPDRRAAELTELGPPLARTLQSASDDLAERIVDTLRETDDRVLPLLLATLRAHQPPASAPIDVLAQDCWERTVRYLARPERSADDWSISCSGCGCADCAHLADFLKSPTARTEAWPLAQRRRQHIHWQIDRAGLPVSHVTRRQGRPFSLILTKTDELFTRESAQREAAEADLRWLVSTFG